MNRHFSRASTSRDASSARRFVGTAVRTCSLHRSSSCRPVGPWSSALVGCLTRRVRARHRYLGQMVSPAMQQRLMTRWTREVWIASDGAGEVRVGLNVANPKWPLLVAVYWACCIDRNSIAWICGASIDLRGLCDRLQFAGGRVVAQSDADAQGTQVVCSATLLGRRSLVHRDTAPDACAGG